MKFRTPQELIKTYENGFIGSICDERDKEDFLSNNPRPLFGDYSADIKGSGKGKLSLPFKSVLKFDSSFGAWEQQTTGDCVSHACRNAVDVNRSNEILVNNEPESWIVRSATEGIYGSRGHSGQGMSCSRAGRFVSTIGGVLLRQKYGNVDLSVYDSRKGSSWGRSNVPATLVNVAKNNQIKTVSLVKTLDEVRDALANGYGIFACSNAGFESKRDKYGISGRRGSWNHAMAWIACDDTREIYNETLFLIQNSWGIWNSGPIFRDQPQGSFWIRQRDAEFIIAQEGCWALSNFEGFPPRKVEWSLDEVF